MGDPRSTYRFGPFSLQVDRRRLLRDGELVALSPKALETLLALVEQRDRVLTKDELLQRIWGDTVVEEGGLPGTSRCSGRRSARAPTTTATS